MENGICTGAIGACVSSLNELEEGNNLMIFFYFN